VSSHELTRTEWCALNALADDIEPVEEVSRSLREDGFTLSADEFLQTMFVLIQHGFVTVSQAPIPAFGQQFSERAITPSRPEDIVRDLDAEFRETYARGDYLRRISMPADSEPGGVPFGIYFDLTSLGRAEWNKATYKAYYAAELSV
jgi:hypothetical protein